MTLIESPQRTHLEGQKIARIHVVVPRTEIQSAMQAALHELTTMLQEQQLALTGPWFAHNYRRPAETFDFDVCFPTAKPVTPSGRVEAAQVEACEVLHSSYTGPYDNLHAAWREFGDWVDDHHVPIRGDVFEVYVTSPRETRDPAQWRTEMNYPLAEEATAASQHEERAK